MTRQCLDKDIKITPVRGRAHVSFDGAEIGSSVNALEVDEPGEPLRIYFPRDDIQPGILEASEKTFTCPYKGEMSYYTIKTLTATGPDEAWYIADPCPVVEQLRDHVAFAGDRIEHKTSEV